MREGLLAVFEAFAFVVVVATRRTVDAVRLSFAWLVSTTSAVTAGFSPAATVLAFFAPRTLPSAIVTARAAATSTWVGKFAVVALDALSLTCIRLVCVLFAALACCLSSCVLKRPLAALYA